MKRLSPILIILLFVQFTIGQNVVNHNHSVSKKHASSKNGQAPINLPYFNPPSQRNCETMDYDARLRAMFPNIGTLEDFEVWLQQKIQERQQMKWPGPANITIPTIVHVIHDGGASNISQAQIMSQFTVLNDDFRRNNSDTTSAVAVAYQNVAIDTRIEFCPALVDPLGNPLVEPGINRVHYSTIGGLGAPPYAYGGPEIDPIIKPATQWDPTLYFNIWVLEFSGGTLGYAQFPTGSGLPGMPGGGAANTDGVVIGYQFFGAAPANPFPSSYNLGRTATHEVGHWLGLRHIWGDGACANDFCGDTPTQQTSNFGCPSFPNVTCGNGPNGDQYNNYMDYVNDNCMNMFSADQNTRMQTVMTNSPRRMELVTSNVCNPNSPPVCSFTSDVTTVTEGGSVSFSSTAVGATSWSWSFPGGTPSTSTAQNPVITYNTAGSYDVTLIATNAFGSCTITVPAYITVIPSTGCDTLNFPPPGTLTVYTGGGGYVCGWNTTYQDVSKAEYFSAASHTPYTHVTGGIFYVWSAADGGNGATVDFNVWDATGAGGSPGAILGTVTVPLSVLNSNPGGAENNLIEILYPSPINVGAADFYFGLTMNGFGAGDSLGIVSNTDPDSSPATAWEEWSGGGGWYAFDDPSSWGLGISQFMSPYMTDVPPTANIVASSTTVCEGDTINFNGTSSVNEIGYNWIFNGGTPATSTDSIATVTFNTAGNYTEYLVVDGACQAIAVDSVAVTVNPAEDATFSYSAATYCTTDSDPTPIITGTGGGTFSATPAGLNINSSTGTIDLSASTPNTYSVLYTTPGPTCQDTMSVLVTVSPAEDATFNYSSASYCQAETDPTPTITGTPGGAFTSSPVGLSMNGTTGTIDLSVSTPNSYTITYITPGAACPDTMSVTVTVTPGDDATFSYSSSAYCVNDPDPTPTITGTGGGTFSSSPAGLSINSSTGTIDVSASTPNTYTVTYITPGPACPDTLSVSVAINALDDASFSYSSSAYCVNDPDPTPTVTGLGGGTFSSSPAGLSINTSTGQIDVSASMPNTYTVTYTTSGTCPNSSNVNVTINALDDATFSYSSSAYCVNDPDPTPTVTGLGGGTFSSSPAGLSINSSTGQIDVSASTPNTYTVTYTTSGTCPNSSNVNVTINALDDASFSYSATSYCQAETDPTPTVTGLGGGTFSSLPAGLSINSTTGLIDVSASTPNTYTVTYTTSGTCPNSSNVNVTITVGDDATFNYSSGTYCVSGTDPTPTISGTGGGTFSATPAGLNINSSTGTIDLSASAPNFYTVTYITPGPACPDTMSVSISVVLAPISSFSYAGSPYCGGTGTASVTFAPGASAGVFSATPAGLSLNTTNGDVDLNLSTPGTYTVQNFIAASGGCSADSSTATITINAPDTAAFNYAVTSFCPNDADETPTITGTGGGTFSNAPGGLVINATTGTISPSLSTPNTYTVTYITSGPCPDTSSVVVTVNPNEDASFGYSLSGYCQNGNDPTPVVTGDPGGTFSATPAGLSINSSTGTIDLSASAANNYSVTYITPGPCPDTNTVGVTINPAEDATFNYSASAYCQDDSDPTPTITGTGGGTFSSSPAGLSINGVSGAIDLSASTPNTYTITYTTIGFCSDTFSVNLTINPADDATFNYSSMNYCQNDSDPTPTISGTGGGSFTSSPAGLSINSSTGTIDLSTSTPNTYTVTYTTSGVCPDTNSVNVTINPAEDATFNYSASAYCQSDTDPTPTISGTAGGSFTSSPAGLSVNSSTGTIDLSTSTPGAYNVTYITPGATCPDTLTVSVTINADEDATFNYSSSTYCNTDPDPTPTISGTGGGTFTSSPAGLNINTSTGTIDLSTSTPGVYNILYTTPGPNCVDTMSFTITINNCTTPPVAGFSASDSTLCIGDCINFTDLSTNNPTNWTWYFFGADTPNSTQQNPTNICYSSAGSFDVALVASNSAGQDSTYIAGFITVNPDPNVVANASTTNVCDGDSVTLTGSGAVSYIWDNGVTDGGAFVPNTTLTYTVTGTDANGCSNSDMITVMVNQLPTIIASNDTSICDGEAVTISASGGISYIWNNGVGSQSQAVSPTTTTTYVVTGTDANGCSSSDDVEVEIDNSKCFNIPNVFSPNGDGKNDTWVLRGIEDYPDISVTIFNRWGGEMYKSNGYDEPWDGTYNGTDSPSATYYYIIDLGDGQEPISGTVNIIR